MEYLTNPSMNISDELETVKRLQPGQVLEYTQINTTGWIVRIIDEYSRDYEVLQENWADICRRISFMSGRRCTPQKLVLVSEVFFNETDPAKVYLQKICDKLTEYGYCIRRDTELFPCHSCGRGIISEELYAQISNSQSPFSLKLPREWSDKCSTC